MTLHLTQTPARRFSHPILTILLAISWMALMHSVEIFHIVAGLVIGLVIPRMIHPFLAQAHHVKWLKAIRFSGIVLWDIVISNVVVARLVLGSIRNMHPAWIRVPLASDHPTVNALFATIITTTPGTVSAVIDEEQQEILVHALNCDDAEASAIEMKARYEQPLLEIFGVLPSNPSTRSLAQ
ncbi:MAG: Na+/H+ antiporter subunit E [Pseudomonadota bacterium]|nr:Na+/H+ antiporter subunit E [Pseudomonadota bacterium]